jgi:neural Wiskott-Aldrich syndrome protein
MADLNEPREESVQITPSPRTEDAAAKRPPAPIRPPAIPSSIPLAPSAGLKPPVPPPAPVPKSVAPPLKAASALPGTVPVSPSPQVGPQKETVRVAPLVDSPMKATVKLPPIRTPSAPAAGLIRPAPPTSVANLPKPGLIEAVPMQFCWALLGVSALLLFIQLWTYFS